MSSGVSDGRPLAWAEQAYALVQARPLQARALAERALAAASAQGDAEAQLTAMYALAWAQNVLGDAKTARKTMRAGIRLGTRYGDGRRVALLRRLLAFSLAFAGESRAAQREIDAALAVLSARDWAQSQVHRLEIHRLAHPADPAVHRRVCADAARALRLLQRDGDEFWEAILLYNRACLYLDRGELDAAEADARRAHTLYSRVGGEGAAVDALEVLGEVALLRGDLLTCLATLEDVEASLPPGHINYS